MKMLIALLFLSLSSISYGENIHHELDGTMVTTIDELKIETYKRMDYATGDINHDGVNDIVAVYKNIVEEEHRESAQHMNRLVIVLIHTDGGYRIVGVNENIVYYYAYDQNFPESFVGIRVGKGYFAIDQYGGFAERWGRESVFRYDAQRGKIFFDTDRVNYFKATDPNTIIRETKITASDIGQKEWTEYNIYTSIPTKTE